EETFVGILDSQKRYKKRKRKEEVSGRNRLTEGKEESSTDQSKKLKKMEREKQLATKKKDEKQTKATATKMALEQANDSFSLNSGKNNIKRITIQSRKKRVGTSDSSSTSSDSDSSELNKKQSKSSHKPVVATLPKDKSQAAANSAVKSVISNKVAVKSNTENSTKTAISKNAKKSQSSSSDSDSSTEDEEVATAQDSTAKEKSLPNNAAAGKTSTTKAPKAKTSSESDSSDSETVIKKPAASGLSNSIVRNCTKQLPTGVEGPLASLGRGRGRGTGEDNFWRGPRGRGFRGMMRGQGRGRGANPGFFYNYSSEGQKQRQLNEAATNTSVLVQNPVEVPKRDYSVLPLLAAPPQVGERIAFKRLELTENYSPEVSDYK
ncbi:PREDICTED: coilin, partial [Phaethon lepturus]|uniref:coilin n=1 Tax=Phaethon lepturus TaxID=97097 RepID=UPI0005306B60